MNYYTYTNHRLNIVALFVFYLMFFTSCNRPINENYAKRQSEQSQKEQEKLDSLQSEREEKVEIDKIYLLHYNNGKVAHNSGDYLKAIGYFNESLKLNPNFAEAWGMRGLSKYKSGDTQSACEDWEKSLQLGATNVQSLIDEQCQ